MMQWVYIYKKTIDPVTAEGWSLREFRATQVYFHLLLVFVFL